MAGPDFPQNKGGVRVRCLKGAKRLYLVKCRSMKFQVINLIIVDWLKDTDYYCVYHPCVKLVGLLFVEYILV